MSLLVAERITEAGPCGGDGQLRRAVIHRLGCAGYAELRGIRVTAGDGVVESRGSVSSYYLRQVAQTAALDVEGMGQVKNHVRVNA